MRYCKSLRSLTAVVTAITLPLVAQENKEAAKPEAKKPGEADMMAAMMEMAKPNENHKQLQEMVGSWSYSVKWWMSPDGPPNVASGTTVSRSVMDGRYVISEHTGKMQMPGPDGKSMDIDYKGMAVEGYDNAKKKFVASWIDNMGTGILSMEGTYDPAAKTLTYLGEYEAMPGVKTKMRQVIKITDKDHRTMEFLEGSGDKEVKTMEITYKRKS